MCKIEPMSDEKTVVIDIRLTRGGVLMLISLLTAAVLLVQQMVCRATVQAGLPSDWTAGE